LLYTIVRLFEGDFMRELALNEVAAVSGGLDTGGYNFSFIITNAVFVGVLGYMLGAKVKTALAIGAGYGALMLAAKMADNYFGLTEKPSVTL